MKYKEIKRKLMNILSGGTGVIGFKYPWNSYGFFEKIQYPYFKKPYWIFQLAKQIYKHVDYYPWEFAENVTEILFLQYEMWFIENEEQLKPWLEDDKWIEHKHSENWEPKVKNPSGIKYKEMLEIYMYIKYIRHENEKKKNELLHLLFSEEAYKTWSEDTDETYDGEKCFRLCSQRLKNYKIDYKYSKNNVLDSHIHSIVNINTPNVKKYFNITHNLKEFCADNLEYIVTELKTCSDKYNKDIDNYHKIEQELIELDNKYTKLIIDKRQHLWT